MKMDKQTDKACIQKKVKADIALRGNPISELPDITCHVGSHSLTCHPHTRHTTTKYKRNKKN